MKKLLYIKPEDVQPEALEHIRSLKKEHPEHEVILDEVLALLNGQIPIPKKRDLKIFLIELALTGLFHKSFLSRAMKIVEDM